MSMLRRHSSKQGLQDLQRITVQRSLEDAEEIERERRQAAKAGGSTELPQNSSSPDLCEKSPFQSCKKPSCLSSSDGVDTFNTNLDQVKRKTQPETCDRAGGNLNNSAHLSHPSGLNSAHQHLNGLNDHPSHSTSLLQTVSSSSQQNDQHGMELYKAGEWREKEKDEQDMRECEEHSVTGEEKAGRQADEVGLIRSGESQGNYINQTEKEQKKEKVSNITTARLEKDLDCDTAKRMRNTLRKTSCLREEDCAAEEQLGEGPPENEREEQTLTCEEVEEVWVKEENVEERVVEQTEEERVLEEIEEERVLEETEEEMVKEQTEEEKVLEETEEEMVREHTEEERVLEETEEEIVKEQIKNERVVEETEEERVKRMREEEREKKRLGVMERMKRLSLSSAEADEPFSPLSPTLMDEDTEEKMEESMCSISDRTESLNQSVKRSNSFQKTSPSVTISKIDSRLEQYNHAVEESAQETKDTKAVPTDFPTTPEPVSARKNLFEAGDVWNQNSAKAASPTDTEGLNVGVADLITHWVKGNPDADSKMSSCKPTSDEVKAGDVRNKKSLWESKETSTAEKPGGKVGKNTRYKFVEVSHGKYEKVLVEEGDSSKLKNGK
uniref:Lymphocyte specific protein 1 b n=1 Tax=Astyanax mexicanus TaxID=7994 RepID=A0A3B1IU11_ASTMX